MTELEIIEALQRCELFSTVTEEDIKRIAELCRLKAYEAGSQIITQGEYGTKLYLIAEGQVALLRLVNLGGRQGTLTVDLLGKGRGLGWSALLCEPCGVSVSAVCQRATRIVSLDGVALRVMLEEKPDLGFIVMDKLAHVLGDRLRAVYGAVDTLR